jgi:hypothetical protein
MGNSDSLANPVEFRPLISTGCPPDEHRQGSPTFIIAWLPPACRPCYPGSPSIGCGSFRQDRCSGLPLCRRRSTTPLRISRLHPGSLALRPAGLLSSLKEPLSGNLVLQVTLHTSLKLRGRTVELPRSDSNRQVIRFTRHALLLCNSELISGLVITEGNKQNQSHFWPAFC